MFRKGNNRRNNIIASKVTTLLRKTNKDIEGYIYE